MINTALITLPIFRRHSQHCAQFDLDRGHGTNYRQRYGGDTLPSNIIDDYSGLELSGAWGGVEPPQFMSTDTHL